MELAVDTSYGIQKIRNWMRFLWCCRTDTDEELEIDSIFGLRLVGLGLVVDSKEAQLMVSTATIQSLVLLLRILEMMTRRD